MRPTPHLLRLLALGLVLSAGIPVCPAAGEPGGAFGDEHLGIPFEQAAHPLGGDGRVPVGGLAGRVEVHDESLAI